MTEERRLLGNSEILSDALGSLGTCKRHPNRVLLLLLIIIIIIVIVIVVVVIVIVIIITVILICIVNINGNITETGSIKEPISVGVIPILPL